MSPQFLVFPNPGLIVGIGAQINLAPGYTWSHKRGTQLKQGPIPIDTEAANAAGNPNISGAGGSSGNM